MNSNKIPKLSTIRVEKLRLRAYIGFIDWEKVKLQDVVISYTFKYNTANAVESDDVADAVNYKTLTKQIIDLVDNQKFHLIEFLADTVYAHIQNFNKNIEEINVKVEKPNALRFSDNVLVEVNGADRYNTVMITLGANIAAEENISLAVNHLTKLGTIVQKTATIQTEPLKFEAQADFLNCAVLMLTHKSISALSLELRQIEALLGRVRTANKNAPRTIDLDITTYNNFLIDQEVKELPFIIDFMKELRPALVEKIN